MALDAKGGVHLICLTGVGGGNEHLERSVCAHGIAADLGNRSSEPSRSLKVDVA